MELKGVFIARAKANQPWPNGSNKKPRPGVRAGLLGDGLAYRRTSNVAPLTEMSAFLAIALPAQQEDLAAQAALSFPAQEALFLSQHSPACTALRPANAATIEQKRILFMARDL